MIPSLTAHLNKFIGRTADSCQRFGCRSLVQVAEAMAAQAQRADAQLEWHATEHLQVTYLPNANPRVPRKVSCRRKRISSNLRTLHS